MEQGLVGIHAAAHRDVVDKRHSVGNPGGIKVGGDFVDHVVEVDLGEGDGVAVLLEAGHCRDVVHERAEPLDVGLGVAQEAGSEVGVHVGVREDGVDVSADDADGGFKFVVDIVG